MLKFPQNQKQKYCNWKVHNEILCCFINKKNNFYLELQKVGFQTQGKLFWWLERLVLHWQLFSQVFCHIIFAEIQKLIYCLN